MTAGTPAATSTTSRVPQKNGSVSLMPREHGAYGQLFLPVVVALAFGSPTASAVATAVSAALMFFAHEPMLVLLGHRGAKNKTSLRQPAFRRFAVLASTSAALGLFAFIHSESVTRAALAMTALLGGLMHALVLAKREKTVLGETAALLVLSAVSVPISLASGCSLELALHAWAAWVLAFLAANSAVRMSIQNQKRGPVGLEWVLLVGAILLGAVAVLRTPLAASAWPVQLGAVAVALARPHPKHLKRVGWTLASLSVLTGTALVVMARSRA